MTQRRRSTDNGVARRLYIAAAILLILGGISAWIFTAVTGAGREQAVVSPWVSLGLPGLLILGGVVVLVLPPIAQAWFQSRK